MKKSMTTLLLGLLAPALGLACSLNPDYPYYYRNDLITEFLRHPKVNATIDHLDSLSLEDYSARLFFTFPDKGADCPDSVALEGTVAATFRREVRYNSEKSAGIWKRFLDGEIGAEEREILLSVVETCSFAAKVESRKIPQERGQFVPFYETTLEERAPLECVE